MPVHLSGKRSVPGTCRGILQIKKKSPILKTNKRLDWSPPQKKIKGWGVNISELLSIFGHWGNACHGHSGQDDTDARWDPSRMLAEKRRWGSPVLLVESKMP